MLVCTPPMKIIGSYALDVAADVGSVRCVSISAWMCVEDNIHSSEQPSLNVNLASVRLAGDGLSETP